MTSFVLVAAGIVIGRLWGWLRCGTEAEAHRAIREVKALRRAGEAEMAAIARDSISAQHTREVKQTNHRGAGPRHAAPRK